MSDQHRVWIGVASDMVKDVKTLLETSHRYDRSCKIVGLSGSIEVDYTMLFSHRTPSSAVQFLVPTTVLIAPDRFNKDAPLTDLFSALHLRPVEDHGFAIFVSNIPEQRTSMTVPIRDPVRDAVQTWLRTIPNISDDKVRELLNAESWSYQIYTPLLLLGPAAFTSKSWHDLRGLEVVGSQLEALYNAMCDATKCTHLAINAPISLHGQASMDHIPQLNVLRSPTGLLPLRGDFGDATDVASKVAFQRAFWVNVRQNGIQQTFAPLHTMFSRGNVKEKARILQLSGAEETPFTAVDLYAGIGYFAFSYARGGAQVVLGWEINCWSVQGFQRGSRQNGWDCTKYEHAEPALDMHSIGRARNAKKLAIFAESNECAGQRVEQLKNSIPPIKHVNCGYLPSSQTSWATAVQCLDPINGGCIHAHENVGVTSIQTRRSEIEECFRDHCARQFGNNGTKVHCEHVEQVKSYAPGVIHCVFDIRILPTC